MSHTSARRTVAALLFTLATIPTIASPAAASTTTQKFSAAPQICPGILCAPFWKTDPARKPKAP